MGIDWGFVISVTLTGLVVVFAALILLVAIIMLFGKIGASVDKSSEKKPEIKPAPKAVTSSAVKPTAAIEDDTEIIAVITAAISALRVGEGKTGGFKIRSIKQNNAVASRKAWSMAGIADNTRPF